MNEIRVDCGIKYEERKETTLIHNEGRWMFTAGNEIANFILFASE